MGNLFGDDATPEMPIRLVRIFRHLNERFEVFIGEDRDWVESIAVGRALGYKNLNKFWNLLDRYRDELWGMGHVKEAGDFLPKLGRNSTQAGRPAKVYLDAAGVIKAAGLAKTPDAKLFREWVATTLAPLMFSRGKRMSVWSGIPAQDRIEILRKQEETRELDLTRRLRTGPYLAAARVLSHARAILELGKDSGVHLDQVNSMIELASEKLTGQKPYPLLQPLNTTKGGV